MPQNSKVKVLVTSAGTASAVSVIKALRQQEELSLEIYATDMDPLAAGLYLADHFFISPSAKNPSYIPSLINFVKEKGIHAIIPIYSKEISLIAKHSDELEKAGGKTFLPEESVISTCNDKIAIAEILKRSGIKIPQHYSRPADVPPEKFPVFFKPNFSSSSSGAIAIENLTDLQKQFNACPGGVIQELLKGQEITVDVFCNEASEAVVIAPRIRLAVKSGQTVKGETIDASLFKNTVEKICSLIKMKGACNIQFFLSDNQITFLEINPRFAAGGLMLTVAAGANIPLLVLKQILGIKIKPEECKIKPGVKMTRYWEEIII